MEESEKNELRIMRRQIGAYMGIQANIDDLMQERGIGLGELSMRLGLKKSHVKELVFRNNNYTLATLSKIAAALGVEVADFFRETLPSHIHKTKVLNLVMGNGGCVEFPKAVVIGERWKVKRVRGTYLDSNLDVNLFFEHWKAIEKLSGRKTELDWVCDESSHLIGAISIFDGNGVPIRQMTFDKWIGLNYEIEKFLGSLDNQK